MNPKDLNRWQYLTQDGSVRWLKYSWGPATANTLAARLADGTWVVVAPSVSPARSVLEDLSKDGFVSALIAPNAYHYLGQQAWRLHFPGATSYAPAGAHKRTRCRTSFHRSSGTWKPRHRRRGAPDPNPLAGGLAMNRLELSGRFGPAPGGRRLSPPGRSRRFRALTLPPAAKCSPPMCTNSWRRAAKSRR